MIETLLLFLLVVVIILGGTFLFYFQIIEIKPFTLDSLGIELIDDVDILYMRKILSEETIDSIVKRLGGKREKSDPNSALLNNLLLESRNNQYGDNKPWDKEATVCDTIDNKDMDLYGSRGYDGRDILTLY